MEENKQTLTPEEKQARKEKLRTRLFVLLIILDVILVGYLIFEMVSIFTMNKKGGASSSVESATALLAWFGIII